MRDYKAIDALINEQMKRTDLTPDDILKLTVAQRLNLCSENTFAEALSGGSQTPPLNFWGKR